MGDPGGQRLIWFALGSQQLHLIIRDEKESTSTRHIAVYVHDFDSLITHLRNSGVRLEEPQPGQFWARRADESRYAFCYDPDGNRIELMESPDASA
jgi:catechol 2,3-dioxygenase-like lactoylglutathione lyase family enzyme